MAVKNISKIGPSGNIKPIPIWMPIPPSNEVDYEFKIETDTETISLKDLVMKGSLTDGVTTTIGSFELSILDPDRTIYNKITNFDKLKFYADYGTPNNLRFTGYIERRGYQDIYTVISGRSLGMIFVNKNIIYNSDGKKKRSEILKEILDKEFSSYSINVDNIEEDTSEIEVNYYEIPMIDIIEEICGSTHDFYLDHSFNAHYFEQGSRTNSTDGISELQNHIETPDNADDSEETYTKVRTYGQIIDSLPVIYSSDSDTSLTKGVFKDYKLDNSSLLNSTQAEDLTNREYAVRNQIPRIGAHSSLLLPTLQPGEKLFVGIPREDVNPGYYTINEYTHEFDLDSEYDKITTINIIRRRQQVSDVIKKRINFENKITENLNPNNLDYSEVITFEEDSGTHTNTEINEGYLKVKLGESSGQWISDIISLSSNPTKIQFKMVGDLLIQQYGVSTSRLWFSLDGGTTWIYSSSENKVFENKTGTNLRIRIDLNSSDAKVKAVGALYST